MLKYEDMLKRFNALPENQVNIEKTSRNPYPDVTIPNGVTKSLPEQVMVRVDHGLRVALADLPEDVVSEVKGELSWRNPLYLAMRRKGKEDPRVTPRLLGYHDDGEYLYMARGFAGRLMRILQGHRLQGKYEDATTHPEPVGLTFHGELYGYQKAAIREMGEKRFQIIAGFIGVGKKVLTLYLAARASLPVLVVVRTKVQAYQWVEAGKRFLNLSNDHIGIIGDGRADLDRVFTVGIEKSLVRYMDEMAPRVGYLVVDQCDYAHLNIFFKIVRRVASPYMLGLAVTGRRKDKLNGLMAAYVGPVLHRIPMERVRREARMTRPEFVGRQTAFDYRYQDDWGAMVKALALDGDRNTLLVTDILMATADKKARAVVLCQLLVHMEVLVKQLEKRYRKAVTLSGKTPQGRMDGIREDFNKGKAQVLCVTGQSLPLLKPKRITHLFIASPLRSPEILSQAVGLLLRMDPDTRVQVFDYQDKPVNLAGSYRGRLRVYRDMGVVGVG